MTNYVMTRSEVDIFIRDYAFQYNERNDKYNLLNLPYGWFIQFHKTRLYDGRLCITVEYQHIDGEKWDGGSQPCYSFEEVLEAIKTYKSLIYKDKPQQLSIFDI